MIVAFRSREGRCRDISREAQGDGIYHVDFRDNEGINYWLDKMQDRGNLNQTEDTSMLDTTFFGGNH